GTPGTASYRRRRIRHTAVRGAGRVRHPRPCWRSRGLEDEFVAGLRARLRGGARGELDDLGGPAREDRGTPRGKTLGDAHDAAGLVDEHRIDGEAHEPHRDGRRLRQAETLARTEAGAREQPQTPREARIRDAAVRREDGPLGDVPNAKPRGSDLEGPAGGQRGEGGRREDYDE